MKIEKLPTIGKSLSIPSRNAGRRISIHRLCDIERYKSDKIREKLAVNVDENKINDSLIRKCNEIIDCKFTSESQKKAAKAFFYNKDNSELKEKINSIHMSLIIKARKKKKLVK